MIYPHLTCKIIIYLNLQMQWQTQGDTEEHRYRPTEEHRSSLQVSSAPLTAPQRHPGMGSRMDTGRRWGHRESPGDTVDRAPRDCPGTTTTPGDWAAVTWAGPRVLRRWLLRQDVPWMRPAWTFPLHGDLGPHQRPGPRPWAGARGAPGVPERPRERPGGRDTDRPETARWRM